MDIVSLKILVGACFGIVRFLAGLLPFLIYKVLNILNDPPEGSNINKQKREKLVESAFLPFQSFSGGALFATCLLHMVPSVNQAVDDLKSFGLLDSEYPFSQLIFSSGFLLVYFLEEISQYVLLTVFKEEEDYTISDQKEGKPSKRNNSSGGSTFSGRKSSVKSYPNKMKSLNGKEYTKEKQLPNNMESTVERITPIGRVASKEILFSTDRLTKVGLLSSVGRISIKSFSLESKVSIKSKERPNRRPSPIGRLSPLGRLSPTGILGESSQAGNVYSDRNLSSVGNLFPLRSIIQSSKSAALASAISVKPGSLITARNGVSYEINFLDDPNPPYSGLYKQSAVNFDEQKPRRNSAEEFTQKSAENTSRKSAENSNRKSNQNFINQNSIRQNFDNSSSSSKNSGQRNRFPLTVTSDEELEIKELTEVRPKSRQQILRYILVVLALSSHAIFEGIAIGLQRSVANTWYLLVALSIHSASNLFAIGLDLVKERTSFRTIIIQVFVIAITSPLGVYIGLGISLSTTTVTVAESVALVVLEGLSAGTILYIVFFEVLRREKELGTYRFRRGLCIGAGFALLAYLQYSEVTK